VHAVSLRCTHLGCLLHFNQSEPSWDCPCHASRFSVEATFSRDRPSTPLERRAAPATDVDGRA
jgi:Rieske Fe-S protein